MKYILDKNKLWIQDKVLSNTFGIPEQSIKNRISEQINFSQNWANILVEKCCYIDYSSIPNYTRNKYSMPNNPQKALEIVKTDKLINTHKTTNALRTEYTVLLESSLKKYAKCIQFFVCRINDVIQLHNCARKYALLSMALDLIRRDGYGSQKLIIEVFKCSQLVNDLDIPRSDKGLYNYLSGANKAQKSGMLVKYIRHGLTGKKSNNSKINDNVEKTLIYLASNGNHLKHTTITHQLNILLNLFPRINSSKLLSRKAVNTFLNKPEIHNLVAYASDPDYLDELEPEVYLEKSSYPLQRIYIDGTKLQFVNKDDGKNIFSKVIIVILDSFSSKVLGYSISATENTIGLMSAIRMMMVRTGHNFPEEVVTDKGSAMRSKAFTSLITKIDKLGIRHKEEDFSKIELIQTSNPRSKGSLERFFRSFQDAYLRPNFGFIGEGIKAKNKKAHPNRIIKASINNPDFLRNEDQLMDFISVQFDTYNKFGFDLTTPDGPNDLFNKNRNKSDGISVHPSLIPYLCFPSRNIKFKNCAVRIFNDKCEYIFQKPSIELALKLNNKNVDCYVDFDCPEDLYLYDSHSFNYIGAIPRQSRIPGSKRKRNIDQHKIYEEIMKGKNQIKNSLDIRLKTNTEAVTNILSKQLPFELISYSTETKDSIYLMEFLEEIKSGVPNPNELLYNSTKNKSKRKTKKTSVFSSSTF